MSESKEFVLTDGAKLIVSEAAFEDATALLESLVACAEGIALPDNLMEGNVSLLKDAFAKAIRSADVKRALFKCAQRATYQGIRVEPTLFDDPKLRTQARGDYFMILWHIVEVNCGPFFVKTFSALKDRLKINPYFQKSSLQPEAQ